MYDVVVNGEWSVVGGQFPGSVYSRLTIHHWWKSWIELLLYKSATQQQL